ncbi:MAG: ATP-binding cassette domain-containing protein [Cryobacterium sp.]|nr:ATP-binding cassette domain-containing protein [Cryobacterium sp.]
MISFDQVTFQYQDAAEAVLQDVSLAIPEGELCLVVGETGSGKSTLLQLINGLAPHFTGGRLAGNVTVGGLDTRTHPPRDLAEIVGFVGQDPISGFVTDRVEDELAYSMEQLGIAAPVMRQRVEEVIDLLALARIRHRPLSTLSAGEQQRVAIGAALTAQPRVLVLDEPTSALDPSAAEEVLAALLRLVHDVGVTVVLAEHRLERVIQYADSVVLLGGDGSARSGPPGELMATSPVAPPIIELGRLAGWEPLPLSLRDARRVAGPLRDRLAERVPVRPREAPQADAVPAAALPAAALRAALPAAALHAVDLNVRYGRVTAVNGIDLTLKRGEITALMGRNGSGKSSLLWALQGSGPRSGGSVRVGGIDPSTLPPDEAIRHIVLVPQRPSDLLYLETVAAECRESDRVALAPPGTTSAILERLSPGLESTAHPRDLSEGQRLALVLAVQLAGAPAVVLLDEPTRGLDYGAKMRLRSVLTEHILGGASVLLSSHDVEFVARTANRVVVLSEGDIITDGPARDVLTASATFAPQVFRILRPVPFLTVDAVRDALGVTP